MNHLTDAPPDFYQALLNAAGASNASLLPGIDGGRRDLSNSTQAAPAPRTHTTPHTHMHAHARMHTRARVHTHTHTHTHTSFRCRHQRVALSLPAGPTWL